MTRNRILLIEDEQRIASFIAKGLRAHGYESTIVRDGTTGLESATRGDFDAVVLDLSLPGLDGMSVLRRLRAAGSRIPVIVLTARDSAVTEEASFDAGADDYLTKPFRFDALLELVQDRVPTDTD